MYLLYTSTLTLVDQSGQHKLTLVQSRGIMQGRGGRTKSAYYVQLFGPGHQAFNTQKQFAEATETCWEDVP